MLIKAWFKSKNNCDSAEVTWQTIKLGIETEHDDQIYVMWPVMIVSLPKQKIENGPPSIHIVVAYVNLSWMVDFYI